jgi:hypothetical protein
MTFTVGICLSAVELGPALDALARGDSSAAIERLGRLDRMLAGLPSARPGARVRLAGSRKHSFDIGIACSPSRIF